MNKVDKEIFKTNLINCLKIYQDTGDEIPLTYFVRDNDINNNYISVFIENGFQFIIYTTMISMPEERMLKFYQTSSEVIAFKQIIKSGKLTGSLLTHPDFICIVSLPFTFPTLTMPDEV